MVSIYNNAAVVLTRRKFAKAGIGLEFEANTARIRIIYLQIFTICFTKLNICILVKDLTDYVTYTF